MGLVGSGSPSGGNGSFPEPRPHTTTRVGDLIGRSISVGLWALVLTASLPAQVPGLRVESENTRIDGASLWLFAIDDGSSTDVAVSSEHNGRILVGRLDPRRPGRRVDWQEVASAADTAGMRIADHWHLFAHGHHWLAFSTDRGKVSYLLQLDRRFRRRGLWKVADHETHRHGGEVPTNDMFAVAEPDGIAVGHFLPGHGNRIFRFTTDGKPRESIDIGGGRYAHANGASALPHDEGFTLLAPDTLAPDVECRVSRIEFDADWNPRSIQRLIDEPRTGAAMPSAVWIAEDRLLLHARIRTGVSPRRRDRGRRPGGGAHPSDEGSIVRFLFDENGQELARETIAERGNRPHTILWGSRVLTTWDGEGLRLRVDRLLPARDR